MDNLVMFTSPGPSVPKDTVDFAVRTPDHLHVTTPKRTYASRSKKQLETSYKDTSQKYVRQNQASISSVKQRSLQKLVIMDTSTIKGGFKKTVLQSKERAKFSSMVLKMKRNLTYMSDLKYYIKQELEKRKHAPCRFGFQTTDDIIMYENFKATKFTSNKWFPEISEKWLKTKVTMTLIDFVSELINKLNEVYGVLEQYNDCKASGMAKRRKEFILEKVREKYSKFPVNIRDSKIYTARKELLAMK